MFDPRGPISDENRPNTTSNKPKTHTKSVLQPVAPSWLNMSPWGAMGTPFMSVFIVSFCVFCRKALFRGSVVAPLGESIFRNLICVCKVLFRGSVVAPSRESIFRNCTCVCCEALFRGSVVAPSGESIFRNLTFLLLRSYVSRLHSGPFGGIHFQKSYFGFAAKLRFEAT